MALALGSSSSRPARSERAGRTLLEALPRRLRSERAPGLERGSQGRGAARITRPVAVSRTGAAEKSARARELSAGSAAAESGKTSPAAGSVACQERGHRAGRPRRAHHGLLLGHRGPAVRAALSAALRLDSTGSQGAHPRGGVHAGGAPPREPGTISLCTRGS